MSTSINDPVTPLTRTDSDPQLLTLNRTPRTSNEPLSVRLTCLLLNYLQGNLSCAGDSPPSFNLILPGNYNKCIWH